MIKFRVAVCFKDQDIDCMVMGRGRHWDPNPMGSQSQSQIFGIGIDFSEFWDLDWDRFFKILGLRLGLGSIFQIGIHFFPNVGLGMALGFIFSKAGIGIGIGTLLPTPGNGYPQNSLIR